MELCLWTLFSFFLLLLIFTKKSSKNKGSWKVVFCKLLTKVIWNTVWQLCVAMMSWVGYLLTNLVLPDTWKLREWEYLKFWQGFGYFLKISSESFSKHNSTHRRTQLIIAAHNCHNVVTWKQQNGNSGYRSQIDSWLYIAGTSNHQTKTFLGVFSY